MRSPKDTVLLTAWVLCLIIVNGSLGQNVATTSTIRSTSTATAGSTQVCADKISDCHVYGQSACSGVYETWARLNCAAFCAFCIPATTLPPPCTNYLDNCESYGTDTCTTPEYVAWALSNCRAYCRFCTAEQLAELDARKTTIPPELCIDKLDCEMYGEYICKDAAYAGWAATNCPLYCSFCKGIPTPPKPCVDTQPDCPLYGTDVCSDPDYTVWVKDHCSKFCGLCGAKTSTTSRSDTTETSHSTMRTPPRLPTPPLPSAPPLKTRTTKIPKPGE
ncbi:hypothetical protein BsWGS_01457 [Bradybaena similaris]